MGIVWLKEMAVSNFDVWKDYIGVFIDESFLIGYQMLEEYFNFVGQLYGMNLLDVMLFLECFIEFFNGEILDSGKYICNMFKGNKKKIGIVVALLGSFELVIFDEFFVNFDFSF